MIVVYHRLQEERSVMWMGDVPLEWRVHGAGDWRKGGVIISKSRDWKGDIFVADDIKAARRGKHF